jgi:hypothetical protein
MLIVSTRYLMFDHFAWSSFEVVCPTVKFSVINLISGKPQVKSIHAHSPPTHVYTKTSVDLNIDLPTSGSVKKFIYASLFTDTLAYLKISKKIFQRHIYMVVVSCCLFFQKKNLSLVSKVRSNLITKKTSTEYNFIRVMLIISVLGAPIINE